MMLKPQAAEEAERKRQEEEARRAAEEARRKAEEEERKRKVRPGPHAELRFTNSVSTPC